MGSTSLQRAIPGREARAQVLASSRRAWAEGVARRRVGAAVVPCSATGWLARADAAGWLAGAGGQAALLRCSGNGGCSATGGRRTQWGFYSALSRHGSGHVSAAPRSVARQSPATSSVSDCDRRHVSPLPRHHEWRDTDIWPHQGNRRGQKC